MNAYYIYVTTEKDGRFIGGGAASLDMASRKACGMGDGEYEIVHRPSNPSFEPEGPFVIRVKDRKAYLRIPGGKEILLSELG